MKIKKIIKENIRKVLKQIDIIPTDKDGDGNFSKNEALNKWKMIYRLMDNTKVTMDSIIDSKGKYNERGRIIFSQPITQKDVDYIINYIIESIQYITKQVSGCKDGEGKDISLPVKRQHTYLFPSGSNYI